MFPDLQVCSFKSKASAQRAYKRLMDQDIRNLGLYSFSENGQLVVSDLSTVPPTRIGDWEIREKKEKNGHKQYFRDRYGTLYTVKLFFKED